VPTFQRRARNVDYWLLNVPGGRLAAALSDGANASTPAAVTIPLDQHFGLRAAAALQLWRIATGREGARPPHRLTRQRRERLRLTLRALDGRLSGESYRSIAQGLFGHTRIPAGAVWKTHELRDRTIRLARAGHTLMRAAYLDLLRSPLSHRE
jgi:hypothetical protein